MRLATSIVPRGTILPEGIVAEKSYARARGRADISSVNPIANRWISDAPQPSNHSQARGPRPRPYETRLLSSRRRAAGYARCFGKTIHLCTLVHPVSDRQQSLPSVRGMNTTPIPSASGLSPRDNYQWSECSTWNMRGRLAPFPARLPSLTGRRRPTQPKRTQATVVRGGVGKSCRQPQYIGAQKNTGGPNRAAQFPPRKQSRLAKTPPSSA